MKEILSIFILIFAFACGSDSGSDHDHSNHDHSNDSSAKDSADYSTSKKTDKGSYTVSYTVSTSDNKVPLNEIFDLTATIEPSSEKQTISIDAAMPSHKHGMNVTPEMSSDVSGDLVKAFAQGMKFHMPGYWEIYVTIGDGDSQEKATFSVMVMQTDDGASK